MENKSETPEGEDAYRTAMNNMADYMNGHNYGLDDYSEYSRDPEWQKLNADLQQSLGMDVTTDVSTPLPESGKDVSATELPYNCVMVNASDIDMTYAQGMDSDQFWNHHGNTKEDYMRIAEGIPDVQQVLDSGKSLDEIKQDPDLKDTAHAYFDPENMIKVEQQADGSYSFADDGRHRIAAAQEMGYDIPVQVTNLPENANASTADMQLEGTTTPEDVANKSDIDMKPEEISSYILKKVVKDAEDTLRMEGKLGDDEQIHDVVITCPAYFGVTERDATKAAGVIAGLNVLAIINEPTAAAITYGVTDDSQNKTVLVYDLGGGTFDITMINIKPGEIRVICTGGDHNLGGKDWDDRVLMYLAEQYQSETGTPDNILEDAETLQELSLAAERAKKLLSAKEKAPVAVNYMGERVRVELTREKFDELTEDLLTRTIDLTREMFKEAEKKGFTQSDVSEILLVGGSSKMPQVMSRVKSEFGIETKMFDPDESVAKGAAIYANKMSEFNIVLVGLVYIWLQPKEATKLRRNFTNLSSVTYVRLTRMDY